MHSSMRSLRYGAYISHLIVYLYQKRLNRMNENSRKKNRKILLQHFQFNEKKRFCFQSQFRWKKWVCVWHRVLLIQHALISAYNTLSMKTTFTDVMMLCIHIPTLFADYKSLSKRIFNGPFAWHPFRNCVNKRVYSTWHSAQKKRPMHKLI